MVALDVDGFIEIVKLYYSYEYELFIFEDVVIECVCLFMC